MPVLKGLSSRGFDWEGRVVSDSTVRANSWGSGFSWVGFGGGEGAAALLSESMWLCRGTRSVGFAGGELARRRCVFGCIEAVEVCSCGLGGHDVLLRRMVCRRNIMPLRLEGLIKFCR